MSVSACGGGTISETLGKAELPCAKRTMQIHGSGFRPDRRAHAARPTVIFCFAKNEIITKGICTDNAEDYFVILS